MVGTTADWRALGGVPTAWFDAPSLAAAAGLAGRVLELDPGASVDVRPTGVRVRLSAAEHAESVSGAARELGAVADPAALQRVSVVVESPNPSAVGPFWLRALGYAPGEGG